MRYIKEGRGIHADSLGNVEEVTPGGVQWLRAGSGIEHAEGKSSPEESANKHGFQIWIDLPADKKMDEPNYGTVLGKDIPEIRTEGGGVSRILGGHGSQVFSDRGNSV